jgi:hypothetical protein
MEISSKRENRVRVLPPHITPMQTLTKNLPQLTLPYPTPGLFLSKHSNLENGNRNGTQYRLESILMSALSKYRNYFKLLWRSRRHFCTSFPRSLLSNCYTKRIVEVVLWLLLPSVIAVRASKLFLKYLVSTIFCLIGSKGVQKWFRNVMTTRSRTTQQEFLPFAMAIVVTQQQMVIVNY